MAGSGLPGTTSKVHWSGQPHPELRIDMAANRGVSMAATARASHHQSFNSNPAPCDFRSHKYLACDRGRSHTCVHTLLGV